MPKNKRNQGNEKLTNSESSGRCCWSLAPASRKARTFSQRIQGAKVVGESCAGSNQQKAFAHLSSPSLLLLLHLFCLFLSPPYGLAPLDIQRRRAQQDKRGICSLAGAQEKIREFEKPPPFIDHAVVNQPCSFLNTLLLRASKAK